MRFSELKYTSLTPEEFWKINLNKPASVITLQAEISFLAKKDPKITAEIKKADILVADGIGFIMGMWFLGKGWLTKCTGIDLVNTLIEKAPNTAVYLWGATSENVFDCANNYKKRGLNVVGFHDGYDKNWEEIIAEIKALNSRVVLVGMGSPEQLILVNRIKKELGITAVTVGGSFDVGSGVKKRAPKIIQQLHMEGPWRILIEPSRVKRLPRIFGFFWYILREKFDAN